VQVADLHHPRHPVQRLHGRLALACARAPAGSVAGLGPPSPAPLAHRRAPGPGLRARAPAGSATGLGAALAGPPGASTGAWPWLARARWQAQRRGQEAPPRRPARRRRGRAPPACAPARSGPACSGERRGAQSVDCAAGQGWEEQPRADVRSVSSHWVARGQTRSLCSEGCLHYQACLRPDRGPHQRQWPHMPLPRRARMSILAAALAPRTGLDTPEKAATVNSTLPPDSVRAWPCAFVLADAHATSHRLWQAVRSSMT